MMLTLTMDVPGATKEEVRRGLHAAAAVFRKHNVSPLDSLDGFFALEGWSESGGLIPYSEEDDRAIDVWHEADKAAIDAICANWPPDRERPESSGMDVVKPEGGWPDQPPEGEDDPDDGERPYDYESERDFKEQYDRAIKEMEERRRS
ncbi:MAG: hypothetical protein KF735_02135 [Chelatococcus sp.]|uniref:hypothetical protein n=1 Tax=Chelatococcus sp. TaxID=1953771 RepID=UPI0025C61BDE|nr:hypothetical protein [Chelatococcus sp.]MBX3536411.1 hypothetical protein [Chelatococcus sp.]